MSAHPHAGPHGNLDNPDTTHESSDITQSMEANVIVSTYATRPGALTFRNRTVSSGATATSPRS